MIPRYSRPEMARHLVRREPLRDLAQGRDRRHRGPRRARRRAARRRWPPSGEGPLRRGAHRRHREGGPARRHRLRLQRGRERRARGPLAPLRPDLLGRGGHRARHAHARRLRPHPQRRARPDRGGQGARVRVQGHADDRPHPRRARRAHDLRPQARALVRRAAAATCARLERARETIAVGKLSGAVGTFSHLPPEVEEEVCARLGLAARAGRLAGPAARPPRRGDDAPWRSPRPASRSSPPRSARCRRPRCARSRSRSAAKQKGSLGHAPQAQPGGLRAGHRPRPPGARQRPGRARERRPVARARHQPLLGGAGDRPRQLPGPRPHAAALHRRSCAA